MVTVVNGPMVVLLQIGRAKSVGASAGLPRLMVKGPDTPLYSYRRARRTCVWQFLGAQFQNATISAPPRPAQEREVGQLEKASYAAEYKKQAHDCPGPAEYNMC